MASFVWTGGGGRCGSGSPAGVPLRLRLRQRGGAAMRRTFEVRRETSEQPDGQARWDRAYQLVFGWAATPVAAANADSRAADSTPVWDVGGVVSRARSGGCVRPTTGL